MCRLMDMWWACEQPFLGLMVGDASVPMYLKPGMFICTNTDKINIYDIHIKEFHSFTHMTMIITKISLFIPTSDSLASIWCGIQNIPDRCCHLHNSCICAKDQSQQAKLCIPGSTAKFLSGCVKMCEDVAPNFG
jgi:hypothetical protein